MKTKINLPFSRKKNHMTFNPTHETTLSFGSFFPVLSQYLAPNEDFKVNMNFFARVAPMVLPTFGDVRVNFHAYFVPFSRCWDYFNDFIRGVTSPNPSSNSQNYSFVRYSKVIQIKQGEIIRFFLLHTSSEDSFRLLERSLDEDSADLVIPPNNYIAASLNGPYNFTKKGKDVWHLLQCLGYNLSVSGEAWEDYMNVLPLLAFVFCYYENFVPQQYKLYNNIRNVEQIIHNLVPDSSGRTLLSAEQLSSILGYYQLAYSPDYFTSMWAQPNAANVNYSSDYITDVEGIPNKNSGHIQPSDSTAITTVQQSIPQTNQNSAENGVVNIGISYGITTPWAITLAQKLQGWFTRHNLAGTDFISSILADFGVAPVETLGQVKFCGKYQTQLKIDSVFDTAGVETSQYERVLGGYAGKGIMSTSSPVFSCSTKEHGMFFVLASVESKSHFVDGIDRLCLYEDKFDFFNPTFDGLNMQAVPAKELHNYFPRLIVQDEPTVKDEQNYINAVLGSDGNMILGFNPRYSERKYTRHRVTGDFNINRLRRNIEGFTLQRNLFIDKFHPSQGLTSGDTQVTLQSIVYERDVDQYNRIFTDISGFTDPIFALFDFHCSLRTPMLPMSESFNQYESEGNSIEVEKNGAYSN